MRRTRSEIVSATKPRSPSRNRAATAALRTIVFDGARVDAGAELEVL
jgi:hypothetical protein